LRESTIPFWSCRFWDERRSVKCTVSGMLNYCEVYCYSLTARYEVRPRGRLSMVLYHDTQLSLNVTSVAIVWYTPRTTHGTPPQMIQSYLPSRSFDIFLWAHSQIWHRCGAIFDSLRNSSALLRFSVFLPVTRPDSTADCILGRCDDFVETSLERDLFLLGCSS
jgi:hypothetical protein